MATCHSCGKVLNPVFEGTEEHEQYDNALHITFDGGYGEFVDSYEGPIKAILCHECAHAMCEAYPWLDAIIQPEKSHTHAS